MSPPLSDMEHSVRAALEDSRCKAALFSTQLLEARSDLERTQQLQLQLVARQLGAAGGKTRSDDGTDTRSSMARARAEVEEEMTAQHEVLVEGVRQRLRAVRERALADATSHLDAVSEAVRAIGLCLPSDGVLGHPQRRIEGARAHAHQVPLLVTRRCGGPGCARGRQ